MNKIIYKNYIFDDIGNGNGKILDGSFYLENSLLEDELGIDTLTFSVRYPLTGEADTSLTNYSYGEQCSYNRNNKLVGKFNIVKVERISRFEYKLKFQSSIGLLDDSNNTTITVSYTRGGITKTAEQKIEVIYLEQFSK